MKRATLLVLAFALAPLAGCASFSHADEARDLDATLAALPGVTDVDVQYGEPGALDASSVTVTARATRTATPGELVDFVTTTYAAFAGPLAGSNLGLELSIDDDRLSLAGFRAKASPEAVERSATAAVEALGSEALDKAAVHVRLDPEPASGPVSHVDVAVAGGPEAVLSRLDRVARAHLDDHAFWRVGDDEGTGWGLGGEERGLPTAAERALWQQLAADLPAGATVRLEGGFTSVQLPASTPPTAVTRIALRHLALLGGGGQAAYDVGAGEALFSVIEGDCSSTRDAVGRAVEAAVGDACRATTHPPAEQP